MTETSSLLRNNAAAFAKTFSSPTSFPVTTTAPSSSSLLNGTVSNINAQDEEEYTIKCICIYTDDDGNTVYCPKCDTWQHIECYYHGKKVPEDHFCADCLPRDLDRRKATDRQRRVREQLEGGDRKVKRPSSKTTKKKHKDSIPNEQTNGWTVPERQDSIPSTRDQPPPAKKPKTNHRTSGSIVSLNGESRKRAYSNVQSYPSPSKSPQDLYRISSIPQYTCEFLELYERDEGRVDRYENEYTITASSFLSKNKADRSSIVNHPDQQPSSKSPFVYTPDDLEQTKWPPVRLGSTTWETTVDGKHPTWRYLVLESDVQKDQIMGEIKGEIGMLEEYCQQQSNENRWLELLHPDPFVFFHPHMNIYIDSRRKGTMYRYLRRSCQPNVTLKTFVSDDGEMRHCFVANQDIKDGSELTAAWFVNPSMFDMTANREDSEQHESRQCEWVSKVLANFGNCACDKSQCPWARLDRRIPLRSSEGSNKALTGRKKKGKSKQAISPMSTGQATNSRAGSEAIKGPDDDEQDDRRSTSDSSRSGVRSRDLTPVNVAVLDADPVLGSGLTARELRKIQAAEKAFERKEGVGDKKKKKRISGGSTLNTPGVGSSKQFGQSPGPSDSKPSSGSPPPPRARKDVGNKDMSTPRVPKASKPIYRSVSVQTDPEDCEMVMSPLKRRKFSTPTQRLLKKVLQDRMFYEQQESNSPILLSPKTSPAFDSTSNDVEMKDVGSAISPADQPAVNQSPEPSPTSTKEASATQTPMLTYPSQAAHTQTHFKSPPAPRLHLQTLPPVPTFANGSVTTPGSAQSTPAITSPATAQSPNILSAGSPSFQSLNASIVTPSPIKKKLSLGDYMNRRNASATPVTEKSQAQANNGMMDDRAMEGERRFSNAGSDTPGEGGNLQPFVEEAAKRMTDSDAIEDSPAKDEDEPDYSPPGASPVPEETSNDKGTSTTTPSMPSSDQVNPNVVNVLAQLAQFSERARSQSAGSA